MSKAVTTIARALNPFESYKPHPKWFVPVGESPRAQLYNGAIFQMLLYAPLFMGTHYMLGRKGSLKPEDGSPGDDVAKSLRANIKLPGNRESEVDALEKDMKKKRWLSDKQIRKLSGKQAEDPAPSKTPTPSAPPAATTTEPLNRPGFMDYYMMGALPTLAAFVYGTLGYAKGKKDRKKASRGKALLEYYKAHKEYDKVLAEKLYPTKKTPSYMNPPDATSPDMKEASVKEAGFTDNWVYANGAPSGARTWLAGAVGATGLAPWALMGAEPLLGLITLTSLVGSFYAGKKMAEKRSPERSKLKSINKALETRQTHRYIPKLVLPKSIGVPQK